jgi:hypothetical protein
MTDARPARTQLTRLAFAYLRPRPLAYGQVRHAASAEGAVRAREACEILDLLGQARPCALADRASAIWV